MSSVVLDASALLASIYDEPGGRQVDAALDASAAISTVNLSEVVARLAADGLPVEQVRAGIESWRLDIVEFNAELALEAGMLRPTTRRAGLSLGDRACLALARRLGLPVLTADRAWAGLPIRVTVQLIR